MRYPCLLFCFSSLVLLACGGEEWDLPDGWDDAEKLSDFMQMPCDQSSLERPDEAVRASPSGKQIQVEYLHAHFRCQQDVEAFVRERGAALDVLVQPIEMDVTTPVRCDCRYDLTMRV